MTEAEFADAAKPCPLVFVEWEDSAQPIAAWSLLASFEAGEPLRCASVGWLIHRDAAMMAVCPNMGAVNHEGSLQVSGVIRIPTRCVVRVTPLEEPALAGRSSRERKSLALMSPSSRRGRQPGAISKRWRAILRHVERGRVSFSRSDIVDAVLALEGRSMRTTDARRQMEVYVGLGFVSECEGGYTLTEAFRARFPDAALIRSP